MDVVTARTQALEALAAVDDAYAALRSTPTDLVGNAFRIAVAERLETQQRVNRGLSYRMFGEITDPPDGPDDPRLPPGIKVRDVLRKRLRITAGEIRRRTKVAARIRPRRSLTGPALPPQLPVLARAVEEGAVGEDHLREICKALDVLPKSVAPDEVDRAEQILVEHARNQDAAFVETVGRRLADVYNPDGIFDERDRAARRGLELRPQGPDGMSRLTGWLTPEARAYLEAIGAAVRPGHHLPDSEQAVVDAESDGRTASQRLHDALAWGLRTGIVSGNLGTHRGIPVTVIATTTVADLEQAARAAADPAEPMPKPARTGGGSSLPMRDLIAMASGSVHYLAVFENHSSRPLYLGRSKRLASVDQRIICYARDRGCTAPNCTEPGYRSEVHHAPDWNDGGRTDADHLYFGCGGHHKGASDGVYETTVTEDGRLAWSNGVDPPEINRIHHPEELLRDDAADDP